MSLPGIGGVIEEPFQIQSIVPVANPTGGADEWQEYVIAQGRMGGNAITGRRSGTRAEVDLQLRQMVDRLNERIGKVRKGK